MKKAIAVIIGTFNPVQKAHIHLGKKVLASFKNVQKVIYVPAGNNYKKKDLTDCEYRYNMLLKACSKIDRFEVSKIEMEQEVQLFTYQTLDIIKSKYPMFDIYLVVGADNYREFHTWKNYEYILQNNKLIVFTRDNDNLEDNCNEFLQKYDKKIFFVKTSKYLSVSSTKIRQCIRSGIDFKDYVPKEVYEYILKNNKYEKKESVLC